ncbi:MAG TPA: glycoside hydrolase family 2 TIM barrel-domain containing protein, partial [Terriglobales bacterium]|nr:glycoside hydrolase family 2 TIM barrel-domain containing protein [Terriglobales bacterium]
MKNCGVALLLASSLVASAETARAPGLPPPLPLREGWTLQAAGRVERGGETISTPGFRPLGWQQATVPTTVLAALVADKVYPEPTAGMNLRSIPGTDYPIGANFANRPMPQDSPFLGPWWFRKEFMLPAGYQGKTVWLDFHGINYRANIWFNGKQIAKSDDVAGTWRSYEFDVTAQALPGRTNVVAVEVYSPLEGDLAFTFVDWNPLPPDKLMGLFREVEVRTSGPVALRYPTVLAQVDSAAMAHLTITALLKNASQRPLHGMFRAQIEGISVAQAVEFAPGESKEVRLTPEQFPQLNVSHPRLWWPAQMGTPNLLQLVTTVVVDGTVSDQSTSRFGIRQITSELNAANGRVFAINGKRILIRGGGWAPDMLLRGDSERLRDEFRYVQDMGLNTIRLEDHLETEEFFDLADEKGILVMAGWICCSSWEHWPKWKPADYFIAEQSLRSQIYRLRSHPSLLMWLNGSDNPPPPDVEQTYLKVESELAWPNPIVSSATGKPTTLTGASGVKMTGPYEYVAPGYWEQDSISSTHQACNPGGCGGAYGFNTETSMGPAVPPIESLGTMLPKEHLWPMDDWWNYHAGGGQFKNLHVFTEALNARYGRVTSVEDYAFKSQLMTYEGVRAMYEAYSRNKYVSTGVIQWMLNNAWPSLIWHLYDFYLRPGGGYFGAKKAMEALHPLYGYDDHAIWVVSSQYEDAEGLKLITKVLNSDASEKFSQETTLDAPADSTQKVLTLPDIADLTATYFVRLRLEDAAGKLVGSNLYWLSAKPETLDWDKSTWYTTPTLSYADFTALAQLPKVKLSVTSRTERKDEHAITHVAVENPSRSLAFFVRLQVDRGPGGPEILPVIWEDNYITLLPGEKREVSATYRASALGTT